MRIHALSLGRRGDTVVEMNDRLDEFSRITKSLGDACFVVSSDGRLLASNAAAQELYARSSSQMNAACFADLCPLGDGEYLHTQIFTHHADSGRFHASQLRGDGSKFVGEFCASKAPDVEGAVVLIVREVFDDAQPAIRDLTLRTLMLDHVSDGIVCFTLEGNLLFANKAALQLWGSSSYEEAEQLGSYGWVSERERKRIVAILGTLPEVNATRFNCECDIPDGPRVPIEVNAQLVRTDEGDLVVASIRDISERVQAEEMFRYLAYHDMLTGLANRVLLESSLLEALNAAESKRQTVGLIYLDLDSFKPINDTLGHAIGDDVLREVANRISGCVRETDVVARPGGDEFVVLLPGLRRNHDLQGISQSIAEQIARPMRISGHTVTVSASVGFAFHEPGEDPESFMIRADLAMYETRRDDQSRDSTTRNNRRGRDDNA